MEIRQRASGILILAVALQWSRGWTALGRPISLEAAVEIKDLNGLVQSSAPSGSTVATDHLSITGTAAGSRGPINWRTDSMATALPGNLHAFSKSFVGNLGTGLSGSDYVFSYSGNPNPGYSPVYTELAAPGAVSRFTSTDILFTAPVGSGATTVTASLRFAVSGMLATAVTVGTPNLNPGSMAAVRMTASLFVPGSSSYGGSAEGFGRLVQSGTAAPSMQSGGFLAGAVFDGVTANSIQLDSMTFPVGVPVTISLSLETAARSSSYGFGETYALADFGHTLTLPPVGDVFAGLPTGYSVDSLQLGIVDNHYTLAVPEPGQGAVILGLGCVVFIGCRRCFHLRNAV